MKITFLGTTGWFDTNIGHTPSILIDTKKAYIILDAGFGITQATKYIKTKKPLYIFLSHPHIDHICGLHTLSLFKDTVENITVLMSDRYYKEIKTFNNPCNHWSYGLKTKEVKVFFQKYNHLQ